MLDVLAAKVARENLTNVKTLRLDLDRDWLRQRVKSHWAALIPPARAIIEEPYRQVSELLRL
jgi:hypothetical protein